MYIARKTSAIVACILTFTSISGAIGQTVKNELDSSKLPSLVFPKSHTSPIISVTYSRDGNLAATTSEDHRIKLWDMISLKELRTLAGHDDAVRNATFSHDGKFILSCSGHTIRLWEVETGTQVKIFFTKDQFGQQWGADCIKFDKTDKVFVTGGLEGIVRLWNINSEKPMNEMIGHKSGIMNVSFSSDGTKIISADRKGIIKVWDAVTAKNIKTFVEKNKNEYNSFVSFSESGKYALSFQSQDENIKFDPQNYKQFKIIDLESQNERIFQGHGTQTQAIAFNEKGRKVYSFGWDDHIRSWDFSTGNQIKSFQVEGRYTSEFKCWPLAISPDARNLILVTGNGLTLIDIETGRQTKFGQGFSDGVKSIDVRSTILATSTNTLISVWNYEKGEKKTDISRKEFGVTNIALNPELSALSTSAFAGNRIDFFHLYDGQRIDQSHREIRNNPNDGVTSLLGATCNYYLTVSIQSDKKTFKTINSTIECWDVKTGNKIHSCTDSRYVSSATISDDGMLVLYGGKDFIVLKNFLKGNLIDFTSKYAKGFESFLSPKSLSISSDNRFAIVGGNWPYKTFLLNLQAEEIVELNGHKGLINSVCFNNQNTLAASASEDRSIIIWNIKERNKFKLLLGHEDWVTSIKFTPNGKYLISGSKDQTVKIWDVESGKELLTIINVDSIGFIVKSPSGLFDASSPDVMKLIYYVKGTEVIELGQIKSRYYEPFLWEKVMNGERLRDVESIHLSDLPPGVTIGEIDDKGNIPIQVFSRGGGIGKVSIKINDKIVVKDIVGKDSTRNTFSTILDANKLKEHFQGEDNTLDIVPWNKKEYIKSRGLHLKLPKNNSPNSNPPNIYIIAIGISDYTDSRLKLHFADKDSKDIARALQLGARKQFGAEKTYTYLLSSPGDRNPQHLPTKANIMSTLQDVGTKANSNDIVILYLAGHGVNWKEKEFFYMTYEANSFDLTDTLYRSRASISSREIFDFFYRRKGTKNVLILDACESGKATQTAAHYQWSTSVKNLDQINDDLSVYVISGCPADLSSYESPELHQGFLTYGFLEGLKEGSALEKGKYSEVIFLFHNVKNIVNDLATSNKLSQDPWVYSTPSSPRLYIGEYTDSEKGDILIATNKAVYIPSLIHEGDDDPLELSRLIDEGLEIKSHVPNSKFEFKALGNVKIYPQACRLRGSYIVEKDKIKLTLSCNCASLIIDQKTIEASTKEGLMEEIFEAIRLL